MLEAPHAAAAQSVWHRVVVFCGSLLVAGCLVAPAAASEHGAQKLRIVGGLAGLNQYVQHEALFWTQTLPKLSNGKFNAEIVPFDRAGVPAQDMLRLMQMGVVPFGTAQISKVAAQDAVFGAVDLAGLNPDMATLKKSVARFRPYLERPLRMRYGIELLAVYVYPAQMVFCNKPLKGLADLAGRRVRVTGASAADFVEAFGAIPVVTSIGDILPNLHNGNINCATTGSMSGNTIGLHEATSHLYLMSITWGLSLFGANQDSWTALDPALRVLLRDELPKLEARIWEANSRETDEGVACNTGSAECRGGRKGKMTAVPVSADDERRRQDLLASQILPKWLRRCGPTCAETWNQTLGPAHGIKAAPIP